MATHLTRSANGKELFIDAFFGREWVAGSMPLDGGKFEVWQVFDRCYNHAQFSPIDPDLVLIAQDYWYDIATGQRTGYDNRIWLLRRGQEAEPIFAAPPKIGHEYWDADGEHIWYVDYEAGTEKVNIHTRERTNVWPDGTLHNDTNRNGHFIVGDINEKERHEFRVAFYNIASGQQIDICSAMPQIEPRYHVHPHPQFCAQDEWIVYTATVNGCADVALVRTADLVAATD